MGQNKAGAVHMATKDANEIEGHTRAQRATNESISSRSLIRKRGRRRVIKSAYACVFFF